MPTAVSFRVSTYTKRPKGEGGLTQVDSRRLSLSQALDWILAELPGESVSLSFSEDGEQAQIAIDWAAVPVHIRNPAIAGT